MGQSRLHYLDVWRAALMLSCVPYHVGRIYGTDLDFMLTAARRSHAVQLFVDLFVFRMANFYVVSGLFSWLLLSRGETRAWLRTRLERAGVPLLAATLLLCPAMTLTIALHDQGARASWAGVADQWRALAADPRGWTYHLWFLHTLLMLSVAMAALRAWAPGAPFAATARWLERTVTPLPFAPVALAVALTAGIVPLLVERALERVGAPLRPFGAAFDLHKLFGYAPWFALGALLAHARPLLDWLTRGARAAVPLAALAAVGLVTIPDGGTLGTVGRAVATSLAGIAWISIGFSATRRWFDRPSRGVRHVADASFTVYLFHLPIALALAAAIDALRPPPLLAFTGVLVVTLALSFGAHELIRRSPLLTWAFNGKRSRPASASTKIPGGLERPPGEGVSLGRIAGTQ